MVAKILALLEHPEAMELISKSLVDFGHVVYKADKFQDAMDILRYRDVDLIIGDVHLQNGGSIFDFLRWVKGDPHLRSVPFVCFSTEPAETPKYLSDGVRTAARALGAAKYITTEKFDRATFRSEIEWLLPQEHAGNYYADPEGNGHGKGFPREKSLPKLSEGPHNESENS
jgi:CheY-like chemotaxis protein